MEAFEIQEKEYFEYTDFEISLLKIRQLYGEIKELTLEMLDRVNFDNIEILQPTNDEEQEINPTFDENDLDHIKQLFIDINEELSKLRNRNYQATFFGDWSLIKPQELLSMIKKLRREVNSRTGILEHLLYEEEVENNIFSDFLENNKTVKHKKKPIKKQTKKIKNKTSDIEEKLEEDFS